MIEIVPLKLWHLQMINVQSMQKELHDMITPETARNIVNNCNGYTAVDGEEVLAIAGLVDCGEGRAHAWSYISQDVGRRLLTVAKAMGEHLNNATYRRVEMAVDCDFPQAHRLARILGFSKECDRMTKYTADGRDCALYAMVKNA